MSVETGFVFAQSLCAEGLIPYFTSLLMFFLVSLNLYGCASEVSSGVDRGFSTSRCRSMDQGYSVNTVDRDLSRTSPNYVCFVLLVQLMEISEVLETGKNTGKDRVELGEAREERAWELRSISVKECKTCLSNLPFSGGERILDAAVYSR